MSLLTQIDNAQANPSLEVRSDTLKVDIQAERDTVAFIQRYKTGYNKFYLMTEQEIAANLCDRLIEDIHLSVKWPDWRDDLSVESDIFWSTIDYDLIIENQAYTSNVRNIAQTIKSHMRKLYVAINAIHPNKNSQYSEDQLEKNKKIIREFVQLILNVVHKCDTGLYTNMYEKLPQALKPILGQEIVVY